MKDRHIYIYINVELLSYLRGEQTTQYKINLQCSVRAHFQEVGRTVEAGNLYYLTLKRFNNYIL